MSMINGSIPQLIRFERYLFVAYSFAIFAHPPNTFWQEAACSRAEPSPGFTAKIVLPIQVFSLFISGYAFLISSQTGLSSSKASHGQFPASRAFFCFLYFFCTSYICRVFSGQGKFCQSQWVGTERRSLAGRNQFIRCSNRIVNLRYDFQYHIFCQRCHFRPVFDVRTELDLLIRICHALAVKYTVCVNRTVEVIF